MNMRRMIFTIAAIMAFVWASNAQELAGKFEFYEDGGRTAVGGAVFVGHMLELGADGTAKLTADGFQTSRDLIGTYKTIGGKTSVYFSSYNEDGVNSLTDYKKGELLLTLEVRTVKGKKVFWTTFAAYKPAINTASKPGGIYFKRSKG